MSERPTPVQSLLARVPGSGTPLLCGRIRRVSGLVLEAVGLDEAGVGSLCEVVPRDPSKERLRAEVVGFHESGALLMPYGEVDGLAPGSPIRALGSAAHAFVGDHLLGRVLDGMGRPVDGLGGLGPTVRRPLRTQAPHPLQRARINEPLETGVRSIDGLCTLGVGQRMGIFAGAGVGKSVLLGMIARNTEADVNVIALIGERGREVLEFIQRDLGEEGLARSVVIAVPGDAPALVRARGALLAMAVAEYFRDEGRDVMLMLDSVTRVARAWRDIALSAGELPGMGGFPPSVFHSMQQLMERAGTGSVGSITGLYTVLVEGDDMTDPIADNARGILDGHLVLDRDLAAAGHYPAIHLGQSKSRVRDEVIDPEHRAAADVLLRVEAAYARNEDLLTTGMYRRGSDRETDAAIATQAERRAYLTQRPDEASAFPDSRSALLNLARRLRALLGTEES